MTLEEKVAKLCQERGYTTRACRFQVIAELMSISPEEAKMVESITRTVRQLFPKDKVGARLEKQWHKSGQLFAFENESKKVIRDRIKFA